MSLETEMSRLEKQLDDCDPEDRDERAAIMEELKEIERELNERDNWLDEGHSRGWT